MKKFKIFAWVLSIFCCLFIFACKDTASTQGPIDGVNMSYNIIFKLETADYSFTYKASTKDVIRQVSKGETLGDEFLILENGGEIQNQEYQFLGWYYYDKNGQQKAIDENTIISAETLNIGTNVQEVIVYAKVKKLWL